MVWSNQGDIFERRPKMSKNESFQFDSNMKTAMRSLLIVVLCCLGLLVYGCATLYVQPATLQQDSVDVTVTVDNQRTPNGLAIIGFPPKEIGINLKRAGKLIETRNVSLKKGRYTHTFVNIGKDKDFKYIIEPRTFVVFEVGQGAGPYKMPSSQPSSNVPNYKKGHKRAQEYRDGQVRDYRLVIELYLLSPTNRDKFLLGFQAAYVQANDRAEGQKYVNILKQSLAGGVYEQAFEIGKKHANRQITDALIQTTIGRSLELGGFELGWKAGYIEGFVQQMSKKKDGDKESLYHEAETMYNSLRSAL